MSTAGLKRVERAAPTGDPALGLEEWVVEFHSPVPRVKVSLAAERSSRLRFVTGEPADSRLVQLVQDGVDCLRDAAGARLQLPLGEAAGRELASPVLHPGARVELAWDASAGAPRPEGGYLLRLTFWRSTAGRDGQLDGAPADRRQWAPPLRELAAALPVPFVAGSVAWCSWVAWLTGARPERGGPFLDQYT